MNDPRASNPREALSEPMPPPSRESGDREAWILTRIEAASTAAKEALRVSNQALEVATEARDLGAKIDAKIGNSPDPAQGIEGRGLLGVLSAQVQRTEDERKRNAFLRAMLAGAIATLGVAATVAGLLKAFGVLH